MIVIARACGERGTRSRDGPVPRLLLAAGVPILLDVMPEAVLAIISWAPSSPAIQAALSSLSLPLRRLGGALQTGRLMSARLPARPQRIVHEQRDLPFGSRLDRPSSDPPTTFIRSERLDQQRLGVVVPSSCR